MEKGEHGKSYYSSEVEEDGDVESCEFFKMPRTTLQTLTKKVTLPPKQAAATNLGRKTVLGDSFEQDDSELDLPPGQKRPQTDDACSLFCDGNFSEDTSGELWVQCLMCSVWARNDCSGAERRLL
jgi:hypothetical protein